MVSYWQCPGSAAIDRSSHGQCLGRSKGQGLAAQPCLPQRAQPLAAARQMIRLSCVVCHVSCLALSPCVPNPSCLPSLTTPDPFRPLLLSPSPTASGSCLDLFSCFAQFFSAGAQNCCYLAPVLNPHRANSIHESFHISCVHNEVLIQLTALFAPLWVVTGLV